MAGKTSRRTRPAGGVRGRFDGDPDGYRAAQRWANASQPVTGGRWLVCKRIGRWYALPPREAAAARGNPGWPGRQLGETG